MRSKTIEKHITEENIITLPNERYYAIMALKKAALLIFERGSKRPSLSVMRHAIRSALRHYPSEYDLERIAECKRCSKIIEKDER
jgi:hypothetical protein